MIRACAAALVAAATLWPAAPAGEGAACHAELERVDPGRRDIARAGALTARIADFATLYRAAADLPPFDDFRASFNGFFGSEALALRYARVRAERANRVTDEFDRLRETIDDVVARTGPGGASFAACVRRTLSERVRDLPTTPLEPTPAQLLGSLD